ncbi:MAG: 4'-phosphopantetheinyl transferase [Myxococcota bacterium]|jgi:4'-phosphopantetheinyl transferase
MSVNIVVHRIALDRDPAERAELARLLSVDERARVARFLFAEHRARWTVARAELRRLLGQALGDAPTSLVFEYGDRGKPRLSNGPEFNLSHSAGLGLLAISDHTPVGVDVEGHRELKLMDGVAQRSFSKWEYARWSEQPEHLRHSVFFACWSRKEAVIKALGLGMAYPLKAFDVEHRSGEPAHIRNFHNGDHDPMQWTLRALPIDAGFSAAVAVIGSEATVEMA